jgi:Lar family restriction alleviation protein
VSIELKPCPFCGGPAEMKHTPGSWGYYPEKYGARCTKCGIATKAYDGNDSKEGAEKAKTSAAEEWNRRTPSSSHPAEGERQSIDTPEFQMLFGALATASINAMTSGNDPDLKRHHEVAWDALIAYIDTWAGRSAGDSRDAERFRYIEEHATTHGGGSGFTITCFVPVDEEDMGVGIDKARAAAPAEQHQTNVALPFAAPAGQHDAIVSAIARGWWSVTPGRAPMDDGLIHAIASEVGLTLACRGRAQGGITSEENGSGAAPSAHLVEQVGEKTRRKAPWPDFKGNPIHEGDIIEHPTGARATVVCYDGETDPGDQWRADYGDGLPSRLVLQIGDKGRAVVVGQDSANESAEGSEG